MKIGQRYTTRIIIPFVTMADIAFLLLIFLIVTSSVQKQPPIKILVPDSSVFNQIEKKDITEIFITANGKIYYNGREINLKNLKNSLPLNGNCVINADKDVDFNIIYDITEILKEIGYEKVSFAVKRKVVPKQD